jgi:hypothetical protein
MDQASAAQDQVTCGSPACKVVRSEGVRRSGPRSLRRRCRASGQDGIAGRAVLRGRTGGTYGVGGRRCRRDVPREVPRSSRARDRDPAISTRSGCLWWAAVGASDDPGRAIRGQRDGSRAERVSAAVRCCGAVPTRRNGACSAVPEGEGRARWRFRNGVALREGEMRVKWVGRRWRRWWLKEGKCGLLIAASGKGCRRGCRWPALIPLGSRCHRAIRAPRRGSADTPGL